MTLRGQLIEASAGYRNHARQAEKFRQERNALVAKALKAGFSQAEIARITGLTRGRIAQLIKQ